MNNKKIDDPTQDRKKILTLAMPGMLNGFTYPAVAALYRGLQAGYAPNMVKISAVADLSFLYYGVISGVLHPFYSQLTPLLQESNEEAITILMNNAMATSMLAGLTVQGVRLALPALLQQVHQYSDTEIATIQRFVIYSSFSVGIELMAQPWNILLLSKERVAAATKISLSSRAIEAMLMSAAIVIPCGDKATQLSRFAMATLLSKASAAMMNVYMVRRDVELKKYMRFKRSYYRWQQVKDIVTLGAPSCLLALPKTMAHNFLSMNVVNNISPKALMTINAPYAVRSFFYVPIGAIAHAASIKISGCKKDYARRHRCAKFSLQINVALIAGMSLLFLLAYKALADMFIGADNYSTDAILVVFMLSAAEMLFSATAMSLAAFLHGLQQTLHPTLVEMIGTSTGIVSAYGLSRVLAIPGAKAGIGIGAAVTAGGNWLLWRRQTREPTSSRVSDWMQQSFFRVRSYVRFDERAEENSQASCSIL